MKGRIGIAFFVISLVISLVPGNCLEPQRENVSINKIDEPISFDVSNLTNHSRIIITCDEDFGPTGYNFSGNGTSSFPFLIENLYIDSSYGYGDGIYIANTSMNFIIRNCVIDAWPLSGIRFWDIDSYICRIENNIIFCNTTAGEDKGYAGIQLYSTNKVDIKNNIIFGNLFMGMSITNCDNLEINNNSISANYASCDISGSNSCTFENNNLTANIYGINSLGCNYFTVQNNTFDDLLYSINLGGSKWRIMYNKFYDIQSYGVEIYGLSEENIIHHNWFFGDSNNTRSLGSDFFGTSNYFYDPETKEGNYWSNWKGWGKYEIQSNGDVYDLYPLTIDFLREDAYPAWLFILPIFGGLVGIGFVAIVIRIIYKKVDLPAK